MITEKSEPVSGDGSPPPLADFFLANIDMVALRLFRLGEQPNYEPSITESWARGHGPRHPRAERALAPCSRTRAGR